jgi:hypothetical protein
MITALDSNILLDVFNAGAPHQDATMAAVQGADSQGVLVISDVVYAELAAGFETRERLDTSLELVGVEVIGLDRAAAFTAGRIFAAYRRSGGHRHHILADFLIAAHALHNADRLLTRDRGFYREYFPDLKLMEP